MLAFAVIVAGLLVVGGLLFNRLVRLRNRVEAAWADIDVQLSRRHDLVPQLVNAVRGYADHERATLEAVTDLRAQAVATDGPRKLGELESALEKAVARLFALREAHPDLKADENFAQLQRDLVEVEDHLQFARRFYNGSVRDLNTAVQRVPDVLIAQAFGFREAEFFQAEAEARAPVRAELGP